VIGGGFYGCCIAAFLARRGLDVVLFERGPVLLGRASYVNQARLHNGYHYPRSFRTAARSHENLATFRRLFGAAEYSRFRAVYAVARQESKVGRRHFERFCAALGLPLRPAPERVRRLFDRRLVEAVYEAEEPAFDAAVLRRLLGGELARLGVEVRLDCAVTALDATAGVVRLDAGDGARIEAARVYNCAYAGLGRIGGLDASLRGRLRHQLAEVALIEPPEALREFGVTIMDGPFFSTMPFPAEGLHSLTHVRYTPHAEWRDDDPDAPDPATLLDAEPQSRWPWMIRDARRFLPCLAEARWVRSLYDVKTLIRDTEIDDARPILFHKEPGAPQVASILGGKIDNIFDMLEVLERELASA